MLFKEIRSFNCMFTAVGLFICAVAITMGTVLLAIEAVPGLQDYNKEKEYHLEAMCTLRYTNITGTRDCTFRVTENCHRDDGCDHRTFYGSYKCVEISVTFEDTDGTIQNAHLFRSYRDAKRTDFECTAYECQFSGRILDFKEDMESVDTFSCHFNPSQPEYVYRDDASLGPVVIYFVAGILLIVLPLIVGLGCLFCKNCF